MKRNLLSTIDVPLLFPVMVLLFLGLTTLFSINVEYFRSQLFFVVVSIFVFIFFANSNVKAFRYYSFITYCVSFLLLFIILIIGQETRGAVRWIEFFGIRVQFSEILKPFFALSFAGFVGSKEKHDGVLMLKLLLFALPVGLFIFWQPDLGNTLIYAGVLIAAMIAVGFPLRWFLAGLVCLAIVSPLLWGFLHDYQRQRVLTFVNPNSDPLGTSYNSVQSIVAVGSGMFFGKGLGEGTQSGLRFLPERHTDFIFASISEVFGFVGALIVIAAFLFLLYRIFVLFSEIDDTVSRAFVAVAFFLILIQAFVNIGMNVGLLPIVGVTLPFVSYGGSSMLSNFIVLGMLSSVLRDVQKQKVLEIG